MSARRKSICDDVSLRDVTLALIVKCFEGEGTLEDVGRVVYYVYDKDTLRLIGKLDPHGESYVDTAIRTQHTKWNSGDLS